MKFRLCILFVMAVSLHHALAVDYDYSEKGGVRVSWHYDDMCGVFTAANTEIIHWVTDGGTANSQLSAYGWSLSSDNQYCAYYPYSAGKHTKEALPVNYAKQKQTGNGDMTHLAACDYMAAQARSAAETCHFDFHHLGSIIRVKCSVPGGHSLTSLRLTAPAEAFTLSATMNAADGTLSPTEKSDALTLGLDDVTVKDGESIIAYLMVAPVDLSAEILTMTLTNADGMTSSALVNGTEVKAGCVYDVDLTMPGFEYAERKMQTMPVSMPASGAKATLKAVAIQTITAFAPDFVFDSEHKFEQITSTAIVSHTADRMPDNDAYDISGRRMRASGSGRIVIVNGKKRIKRNTR